MAALHPASVNTVRVLTLCGGGRVLFRRCFLKIGRAGVLTDNGAAGGIMAGIDPAAGAVCTDGVDETGARYTRHPDSGVTIPGFVLPAWDALTALCDALSLSVPAVRWIGWDAAHTDAGWVIVEGNAQSELIGPQAVAQAGLRAELAAALRRLERPIDIIN